MKKKIITQYKGKNTEELIEIGFWGIEDLSSNNNFLVDDKGITYVFNPGESSAPSLGETKVFFEYGEILHILKKDSPIAIFF